MRERAFFLSFLFYLLAPSLLYGGETSTCSYQVLSLDYQAKSVTVNQLGCGGAAYDELTLFPDFAITSTGCIDWTGAKNRKLAAFFMLVRGDVFQGDVLDSNITSLAVVTERYIDAIVAGKKVFERELLSEILQKNEGEVIVTLTEQKSDGKNSTEAMVEEILKTFTVEEFQLTGSAASVPVFWGRVSFPGLLKLISHPGVQAIERDNRLKIMN